MRQRNGKIEFLRFVFCVVIILFHCNKQIIGSIPAGGFLVGLFPRGYYAVEFFFVVSGYLMARSISKKVSAHKISQGGGTDCLRFLYGKVKSIFPYHMVAFLCLFTANCIIQKASVSKILRLALDQLPGFLLIQKLGFQISNLNSVEWYISAMLIAMAVIYPLCLRHYDIYSKMIAPLCGMLVLGWLFYNYSTVAGASEWEGLAFRCVLRAFAEINLGIFAFRCSEFLSKQAFSKRERLFMSLAEFALCAGIIFYMALSFDKKYGFYVIMAIFALVVLSFSSTTYGAERFNNKLCYFLGRYSLPLYLNQLLALKLVQACFSACSLRVQIFAVLAVTAVSALATMFLGNRILAAFNKSHINRIIMAEQS